MSRSLDEILKREDPCLVSKAKAKADDLLLEATVNEMRAVLEQADPNGLEGSNCAASVEADIENEGKNLKLHTLNHYVQRIGGTLTLEIELPGGKLHRFRL